MGTYRYLATMPVGTGETRISPDGRFTASVTEFTQAPFFTGEHRRWLRYRIEAPGLSHQIETPPLLGPGPGSREIPPVIRWDADSSAVEFVLPSRRLRLGTQPFTQ